MYNIYAYKGIFHSSQNPYQICDKSYYGMYKEVTQDLSKVPYHNFSKTECSGKYLEVAED